MPRVKARSFPWITSFSQNRVPKIQGPRQQGFRRRIRFEADSSRGIGQSACFQSAPIREVRQSNLFLNSSGACIFLSQMRHLSPKLTEKSTESRPAGSRVIANRQPAAAKSVGKKSAAKPMAKPVVRKRVRREQQRALDTKQAILDAALRERVLTGRVRAKSPSGPMSITGCLAIISPARTIFGRSRRNMCSGLMPKGCANAIAG